MFAKILSTGSYLPARVVANEDLTQFPRPSIPLIAAKTGVEARRHAEESETTSDLALHAAQACVGKAGIDAAEIDGIILSTSTPDRLQPPTATRVQHLLGAAHAFALDINAVCSGGVYGLHLADSLIRSGRHQKILVIGAEIYSRFLNPRDFSTYPYFGDGAGAVLLGAADEPGILYTDAGADGAGSELIRVPAGGTRLPWASMQNPDDRFFKMSGREVYEFAVTKGSEITLAALEKCNLKPAEIRRFISHQANINIVRELAARVGVCEDAFFANLQKYGNTASASVFIALDELIASGGIARGDLVALVAFGGGLAWGTSIIRY
jgi:3-oxoacyl-[acyl-carrier-protein] synthase-3